MDTTGTIAERVRNGAMLLDAEVPGWAGKINEAELNLGNCCRCILGQVFGLYEWGIDRLGLDIARDEELSCGFNAPSLGQHAEIEEDIWDAEISALAAAWLVEIRARLAPGPDQAIGARNCPEHAALVP